MSKEREWKQAPEELLPEDVEIVEASIHYWDRNLAEDFGFPELVPNIDGVSFYVAVGMNSEGEIVGAALLSGVPVERNEERWVRERRELFLQNQALKTFGLIPPGNMV